MPGLGPGIHELITRRREDRGGERCSAYSAAPRDPIPPKLVDARAKPRASPGVTALSGFAYDWNWTGVCWSSRAMAIGWFNPAGLRLDVRVHQVLQPLLLA